MTDDNTNPFAIIVHRDFTGDVERFMQQCGNVFHDAWRAWTGGRFEYCALIVNTPARLRANAPAVYYIETAREMLQVIEQSVAECAPPITWKDCVVRQSASHELLKRVLPDDTTWLTLDHVWSDATLREVEARRRAKAEAAKKTNHRNYLKAKKKRAEIERTVKRKAKAAVVRKAAKKKSTKAAKITKPKPAKPLHPWVRGL